MSITNTWFRGVPIVALGSVLLVARQPATEQTAGAAVIESVAAELAPPVPVPVYRSEKRLSSDCGAVRAPMPAPGFAPVAGAEPEEMRERPRQWFEIGAERPLADTDSALVAPGYTVIGPVSAKEKLIINTDKEVLGQFEGKYFAGHTEVLENGDLFALSEQLFGHNAADIARAAGDEYLHV